MRKHPDPPIALLKELLLYEPDTGLLRWKVASSPSAPAGAIAGSSTTLGYVKVRVHGAYRAGHRIAWALHYGEWPKNTIDHINRDQSDNRIVNLRDCTAAQNHMNRRLKGTSRVKDGKWGAAIGYQGKRRHLGTFDTQEQAHQAYVAASLELFGEFSPYFQHEAKNANSAKLGPSPLSEFELRKIAHQSRKVSIANKDDDPFIRFARAVERAHGISGAPQQCSDS